MVGRMDGSILPTTRRVKYFMALTLPVDTHGITSYERDI